MKVSIFSFRVADPDPGFRWIPENFSPEPDPTLAKLRKLYEKFLQNLET